jgi:hypothetical protein
MPSRYDASTKAKTVRLVRQHRADYPTEYAAITAVAGRLGMTAETLRLWIRQLWTAKIYETRPGGAITISAVGADDRPVEFFGGGGALGGCSRAARPQRHRDPASVACRGSGPERGPSAANRLCG